MMKKVLIANRGEIAVRIARACADHGVRSVAVYADVDLDALHTRVADEAYALDGERPADTYLDIAKLLAVAARAGADAVHPGYGFLSESAAFAQAVIDAGLIWIGPPPSAIAQLGDKVQARKMALAVGAPLVAGTADPVASADEVVAFAERHGLPIAIKAAFGGGGRGIKVAWRLDEVAELYASAVREATAAFGRGECFIEQFLDRPRHVEAQVIADTHGHVVVLGTRDCSLQRRNQKLVEEAPAPFLSDAQRESIHRAARDICARAGYVGAGTVEFLLSASGAISFLEVNTRLQVEHPVTEETCGLDLVVEQLRIADGLPLSVRETPVPRGHAIEFRLNAEDVGRGFLPCPGPVTRFEPPSGPGVRVDAGVVSGSVVAGHFDSLMAKLIVTGATRAQAIARARRALAECRIEGVASVLPFHRAVIEAPDFVGPDGAEARGTLDTDTDTDTDTDSGTGNGNGNGASRRPAFRVHTRWIETDFREPLAAALRPEPAPSAALQRVAIEIDGRRAVLGLPATLLQALASAPGAAGPVSAAGSTDADAPVALEPGAVTAPSAGSVLAWKAEDGADVTEGDLLAVMEAMKMEMQVLAPCTGRLRQRVAAGTPVGAGTTIGVVETA